MYVNLGRTIKILPLLVEESHTTYFCSSYLFRKITFILVFIELSKRENSFKCNNRNFIPFLCCKTLPTILGNMYITFYSFRACGIQLSCWFKLITCKKKKILISLLPLLNQIMQSPFKLVSENIEPKC